MGVSLGFLLSVVRSGRRGIRTGRRDVRSEAGKRQQSPERELEQRDRMALPPRDTNTYRGGTVEILEPFCGDHRLLTTVQPYSCRTVASSFPHIN